VGTISAVWGRVGCCGRRAEVHGATACVRAIHWRGEAAQMARTPHRVHTRRARLRPRKRAPGRIAPVGGVHARGLNIFALVASFPALGPTQHGQPKHHWQPKQRASTPAAPSAPPAPRVLGSPLGGSAPAGLPCARSGAESLRLPLARWPASALTRARKTTATAKAKALINRGVHISMDTSSDTA